MVQDACRGAWHTCTSTIIRRHLLWPVLAAAVFYSVAISALTDAIIDGDTLDLDGQRVRLHVIDAFERDQPCWTADGREWACGGAATQAPEDLVAGELVECQKVEEDRYGRVVARCALEVGTDLGAEMVRRGLAQDYKRYSGGEYAAEEEVARKASAGAWQGEFMAPWEWRRR